MGGPAHARLPIQAHFTEHGEGTLCERGGNVGAQALEERGKGDGFREVGEEGGEEKAVFGGGRGRGAEKDGQVVRFFGWRGGLERVAMHKPRVVALLLALVSHVAHTADVPKQLTMLALRGADAPALRFQPRAPPSSRTLL